MLRITKFIDIRFEPMLTGGLLLLLLGLSSCLHERLIGNDYIKQPPAVNLLVFPPDIIFKYNHKGESIPGFDTLSEAYKDSALWVNSAYVQHLSDSILLENYMNNFISELRSFGFTVYLGAAIDSFMLRQEPQSYLLSLSQMQIDEYLYPLEDEEPFVDTVYYKRFDLNAIDFSNWFELSKVNPTEKVKKTMLYSSHSAFDSFDGNFIIDPWAGGVKYRYKIDTITVADVTDMAIYLGKKHASYLYDYFMNQYIIQHLPQGEALQYYYHYNRFKKSLTNAGLDKFEVLGTK
jgi:hypothetical protein